MPETVKIKFVIIGFGHIGKRHAEEILLHPGAELVAIVDNELTSLEIARELYEIPVFVGIEEFFLSSIHADVLTICTPNGLHIQQAIIAVNKNFHVLLEKPAGLKISDCKNLQSIAMELDKRVFCVLQNRYSPPAVLLKELVEARKLGKILWVEVSCYWNRDERYYKQNDWKGTLALDGGTLYTQFSHFIDLLYWIFGRITNIKGCFRNNNHHESIEFEDTGTFHFDFKREGSGVFNYSTSVYGKNLESSFTVLGEKGSVKVGGQYMDKLEFFEVEGMKQPVLLPSNKANEYGTYKGSANNHALVIDNVIKALNGAGSNIVSLEDAMESVGMIENIYKVRDAQSGNL